jgi:AraC-like DNA-binding protein
VRLFILVFSIMLCLMVLQAFGVDMMSVYAVVVPVTVTIVIFFLGVLAFRQPAILSPAEESSSPQKYEKSALTSDRAKDIRQRLEERMDSRKPYLDAELTLPRLAESLEIPSYQLSQVINESMGTSFFELVNRYRVNEAMRLLKDPQRSAYTVLAIAEEAGFNSKTAFNSAFKKVTGRTPSEFRDTGA